MRKLYALQKSFYGVVAPKRTRSPSGRIRTSYQPLFPGYVFLRGDGADRYDALTTNCVSRPIEVPDTQKLTYDLHQLYRVITSNTPLWSESKLESGDRVRIRQGPLQGLEGVIVRRIHKNREGTRLLIAVNFLQQGASIVVEDIDVEAI